VWRLGAGSTRRAGGWPVETGEADEHSVLSLFARENEHIRMTDFEALFFRVGRGGKDQAAGHFGVVCKMCPFLCKSQERGDRATTTPKAHQGESPYGDYIPTGRSPGGVLREGRCPLRTGIISHSTLPRGVLREGQCPTHTRARLPPMDGGVERNPARGLQHR
jgi:hypothetical protein